jgi:hypothetical protein
MKYGKGISLNGINRRTEGKVEASFVSVSSPTPVAKENAG